MRLWPVASLVIAVVGMGCAPPARDGSTGAAQPVARDAPGPSRLTLAVQNDVTVLATKLQVGPGVSGGVGHDLSALSNSPLVVLDGRGMPQPRWPPTSRRGTPAPGRSTRLAR